MQCGHSWTFSMKIRLSDLDRIQERSYVYRSGQAQPSEYLCSYDAADCLSSGRFNTAPENKAVAMSKSSSSFDRNVLGIPISAVNLPGSQLRLNIREWPVQEYLPIPE